MSYEAPPFISTSCIENQIQSFIATLLSTCSNQTHHLPKLTLPNFSGNILEWQSFWDSFESAVHMNQSVPDIQKFNCLKSQLGGEVSHSMLKLLTAAVRDVQSGQVTIMARLDSFIETFQCRDCSNQVVKEYKITVKLGSTPCKEKPKASKPEEQPSKPEEPIKDHQPCDLSGIEVNEIEENKTALDDASEPLEHLESNTAALEYLVTKKNCQNMTVYGHDKNKMEMDPQMRKAIESHMFSLFKREMAAEEKTKFWMDTIVIKMNDKIRGIKNGKYK